MTLTYTHTVIDRERTRTEGEGGLNGKREREARLIEWGPPIMNNVKKKSDSSE